MKEAQLKTLVKAILDLRNENRNLLKEVRELKSSMNILLEQVSGNVLKENRPKNAPSSTLNNRNTAVFPNNPNLRSVFDGIVPFDDVDESTRSILDENINNVDDPVARVLDKIKNTDHRRVLQIMESTSQNRTNNM